MTFFPNSLAITEKNSTFAAETNQLSMKKITLLLLLTLSALNISAQQLAFPDAAGFGRFAKGARASSAPTVYHVTNLNDSGSGSLRDAVSQSNRIVVFDVSGVIKISSRIIFSSNLYIAGQTAPGEGVTVYGNGVSFSGANNIICRYLRIRMGKGGDSGKDCAGISNGTNMIFDHCSFSWGLDETFSINSDGKGALGDITLQNCIFGQGLLSHSAGGLMQADNITLYRNFYCDNSTRNNKVKGKNQYANNVVYNWQDGCYIMGGDSEGQSYCNIQSNLFINGPAKGGNALGGGNANFHFYGDDNWQDSNMDGVFNPSLITSNGGSDRVSTPYAYPELELYPGKELLEKNIPTVGASLPYRDQSDCYMIDEVMSLGKSGKIITYETSLPIGAPDTWNWWKGTKPTDTDNDGMPDAWETANGTNPSKADATTVAANGYLNIENYINSITAESRQYFLRAPITLALTKATTTSLEISWRDYTYAEEGFVVEVQKGSWVEAGRTAPNATSFTITDLDQAKNYNVRVRAFGSNNGTEVYSEYATGTFTTRQVEVGIVDIDTYEPDYTLGDNQTVWNSSTTDWKEGTAYNGSGKVLLNTETDRTLTISDDPMPEVVVVNGTGNLTLSGTIMGSGSMNKGNIGTLVLGDNHTYSGATVIHDGVVEASKLANGGAMSSIGSAIADPQNLVLDGGTFRYTGANASTNRGMRVIAPSVLEIANKATTLTYGGRMEGEGDLTLDGEGTLAVANVPTVFNTTGDIHFKGGMLNLTDIEGASKPFGALKNKMVMEGGHIKFAFKNEDNQTHAFPMEIVDGTTSQLTLINHGTMTSVLTGSGTLQMNIPYLRYYYRCNTSNFHGRIIANGTKSDVIFCHSSQFNDPNAVFTLTGTAFMCGWTTNAVNVIGGLSGDAGTKLAGSSKNTKGFKCSWEVGAANTDEEFKGVICNLPAGKNSAYSGTVSIIKVGKGDWRLSGANDYAGTTKVNGGRLIVNGTHTGTGAFTVAKGAELAGKGSIAAAVTVQSGGAITSGDGGTIGVEKLSIKNNFTANSGAIINIPINGEKVSPLYVTKTITLNEGAILNLDINGELAEGMELRVIQNLSSINGDVPTILPATPGEGLAWDTELFLTKGTLKVVASSTGISSATTKSKKSVSYNLNGQRVSGKERGIIVKEGKKILAK